MNKTEFLVRLQQGLTGLPQEDIDERLNFYNEMISDRMEDGLGEEEAVACVGDVDEIVAQTIAEIPLPKLMCERVKPKRRLRAWEIVLLALGSPIWFSLLIAFFAIVISIYAVIWSLFVYVWAIEVIFIGVALGGSFIGSIMILKGNAATGIAQIGFAVMSLGFAIAFYYVCKATTRFVVFLTKKIAAGIKALFIRKERTE
ncbi:MAG: DUF1700 domain-containing protein [Lachnospiraceae bacterium]|nr:DUF1700 domain-containing protein [Lachnospiraceae bacterium]